MHEKCMPFDGDFIHHSTLQCCKTFGARAAPVGFGPVTLVAHAPHLSNQGDKH